MVSIKDKAGLKEYNKNYLKKWNHTDKAKEARRKYRLSEKGKQAAKQGKLNYILRKYNISLDVYEQLKQNGHCAICGRITSILAVDHDHKTGQVRGLLCRKCNSMISFADDNPLILLNAIRYLEVGRL